MHRTDGSPADPPTFRSSTLNWRQGDKIYLTGERTLRVQDLRVAVDGLRQIREDLEKYLALTKAADDA